MPNKYRPAPATRPSSIALRPEPMLQNFPTLRMHSFIRTLRGVAGRGVGHLNTYNMTL